MISAFLHEGGHGFSKYNLFKKPIKATNSGVVAYWRNRSSFYIIAVLVIAIIFPVILNLIGLFIFFDENTTQLVLGSLHILPIISIAIASFIPDKKSKVYNFIFNFLEGITFSLNVGLLLLGDYFVEMKFKELYLVFRLLTGAILVAVYSIIPLPIFFKASNIILIIVITTFAICLSYLNSTSRFIKFEIFHED